MGLKRKQIVMRQKATIEQALKDRLAALAAKGVKAPKADKDTRVRKLKADLREAKRRLAKIADIDKRTEEMVRIKAEKAAAPKTKTKEETGAKPQKPKASAQEGKAKKPKAPEGGKPPKKAAPAEEGQAAAPKKPEGKAEKPESPAKAEK